MASMVWSSGSNAPRKTSTASRWPARPRWTPSWAKSLVSRRLQADASQPLMASA
jgi:hypothetical protein